jgi:hypothetical protein
MRPTRVLVSYHFGPQAIPLGEQVCRAFERAGLTVLRFDSGVAKSAWEKPQRLIKSLSKVVGQKQRLARYWERQSELATARRFKSAALAFRPDLMLVIRGEPIDSSVIAEVKPVSGAKAVLWWVKTTRWNALMESDSATFDACFTIHQRLASNGVKHLPAFALDRERYFLSERRDERWPILFVGCWSERRQRFLEAIADLPLAIIGPNWRKRMNSGHPLAAHVVKDWVANQELADCYRQATIVVDIGQIDRQDDEGETMRVADVPACGAVLLSEPSQAVAQYFSADSVVTFTSPAELREQLQSLLHDRSRLSDIARQAQKDVQSLPSFDEKILIFLDAASVPLVFPDNGSNP